MFAIVLWLYSPALNGHFIFDDLGLPFCKPIRHASLSTWISNYDVRPVLMISYWLNYKISGGKPVRQGGFYDIGPLLAGK